MLEQTNRVAVSRSARSRRRRIFTRWHRRIGLLSALAVLFLSGTGIALNHLDSLIDDNDFVTTEWLIDWYRVKSAPEVLAFQPSATSSLSSKITESDATAPAIFWADDTLFINQKAVLFNQDRLLGVAHYKGFFHVVTASRLHLFTPDGERIESIDLANRGLVAAVFKTRQEAVLILQQQGEERAYNLETLEWLKDTPADSLTKTDNLQSQIHVLEKTHPYYSLSRHHSLLKSKVLVDLHSGRFFGQLGVLILDFFALCFILLACSGIYIWLIRKRKQST